MKAKQKTKGHKGALAEKEVPSAAAKLSPPTDRRAREREARRTRGSPRSPLETAPVQRSISPSGEHLSVQGCTPLLLSCAHLYSRWEFVGVLLSQLKSLMSTVMQMRLSMTWCVAERET